MRILSKFDLHSLLIFWCIVSIASSCRLHRPPAEQPLRRQTSNLIPSIDQGSFNLLHTADRIIIVSDKPKRLSLSQENSDTDIILASVIPVILTLGIGSAAYAVHNKRVPTQHSDVVPVTQPRQSPEYVSVTPPRQSPEYVSVTPPKNIEENQFTPLRENGEIIGLKVGAEEKPYKVTLTNSPDNFEFAPDEDVVFLAIAKENTFVTRLNTSQNTSKSLIIGTKEYRILIPDSDGVAILQVNNVIPVYKSVEEVQATLSKAGSFLVPTRNFRGSSDPDFTRKTAVVEALAKQQFSCDRLKHRSNDHNFTISAMVDSKATIFSAHVEGELGKGSFGEVWNIRFTDNNKHSFNLAFKYQSLRESDRSVFFNEVAASEGMARHPDSVQFYGAFRSGDFPSTKEIEFTSVFEVLEGDLNKAKITLDAKKIPNLLISTADAYTALHASKRIYIDGKAANVLYTSDGTARLTDYGSAESSATYRLYKESYMGTYGPLNDFSPSNRGDNYDITSIDVFNTGLLFLDMRLGKSGLHTLLTNANLCSNCLTRTSRGVNLVDGTALKQAIDQHNLLNQVDPKEKALIFKMLDDHSLRPRMEEVSKTLREIYPEIQL